LTAELNGSRYHATQSDTRGVSADAGSDLCEQQGWVLTRLTLEIAEAKAVGTARVFTANAGGRVVFISGPVVWFLKHIFQCDKYRRPE
jgi:hypothetical protein